MFDRNYYFIVVLLVITLFFSWGSYFFTYPKEDTVNIKNFPKTVDDWTSQDLPIDKADLAVLETKNVFLRRYTDHLGRHVYLYVAYSETNPKATNPPEVLYNGSGIYIIDKGKKYITIASSNVSFKVNWLVLDKDENQRIAYYWYKVGRIYTHSYWKQRVLSALNNIIWKKSGNALIRISTDVVNGHQREAINLINEFACLLIPQLYQNLP